MTFAMLGHIVFCKKSALRDIENRSIITHIGVFLDVDVAGRTIFHIMQIL